MTVAVRDRTKNKSVGMMSVDFCMQCSEVR